MRDGGVITSTALRRFAYCRPGKYVLYFELYVYIFALLYLYLQLSRGLTDALYANYANNA